MVIRKPYAFLIKNFKKIHIALLLLSLYIYYKVLRTNGFVSEFVLFGSYNPTVEPITKHISLILLIAVLLSLVGNIALIMLLKHKGKPWKLYLVPAIEYGILFFILIWARSFFNFYDGTQTGMDIRLIRDIIFISTAAQFPIVLIYSARILGLDLQKFNFKMDEEYLEMTKEDQAELEINFNIDYHVFVRLFNKTKRYLKYFYLEHKRICNGIAIIIAIILLRRLLIFIFITNKSYKEGEVYKANGYTMVINKSYYTDKNKVGEEIEKDRAFVIVKVSITNNWEKRNLDLSKFHIIKGIDDYTEVSKTYASEFNDLGKTTDLIKQIKRDETVNTLLIYKVKQDNRVNTNKYVLYYQEINGRNSTHLRKIKLDINDISKISTDKKLKMTQKMPISTIEINDKITIEKAELKDKATVSKGIYDEGYYSINEEEITAKLGKKILEIEFSSDGIDGKELIDFSTKYGKIKYDDNGELKLEKIKSAVDTKYYGKYMYIYVPSSIEKVEDVDLVYTIRNKRYTYDLSGGE